MRLCFPAARSSVAAVLAHRGDLELTDDQIQKLEVLDEQVQKANSSIETNLKAAMEKRKAAGNSQGAGPDQGAMGRGGGMGGGMGGRGGAGAGGGRRGSGRVATENLDGPVEKARQEMDGNDARAFEEAEGLLTDAQKPRAEELAEKYREELYDWREGMKKRDVH